ncbi:MAG: GspH/FimT family pseudopilin [Nitrospirae bacterium]|nr:GspH/FimT family pseudopilin [Nitrospirota bacterium]MCL5238736.1 GspH/FimT family pseudopilin [Nitrospirota bacterium]
MKQNGYTLLELIVIIAVICILISIAAFNYTDWTIKFGIESQIKEMYSDLMAARMRAMTRNRAHFVSIAASYYTIKDDTDGNGENDPGDALLHHKSLGNMITWNGNPEISFNSRGISSASETISVSNAVKAAYDCIVISKTRINIGKMSRGRCVHK